MKRFFPSVGMLLIISAGVGLTLRLEQTALAVPDSPPSAAPINSDQRKAVEKEILDSFRKAQVHFDEVGKIILSGSVRSPEERAKIENNAIRVVGSGRVVNQIQIETPIIDPNQKK